MIRRWTLMAMVCLLALALPALARDFTGWKAEVEKLLSSGNVAAAMEKLEAAKTAGNEDADFYFLRAKAQTTAGQFENALADVTRAIELDGDFPEAVGHLAVVQINLGQFQQSIQTATRALELEVDPEIYYVRGAAYTTLGRFDNALADLNDALVLDADRTDYLIARGEVQVRLKKFEQARRDYDRAIEKAPEDPRGYLGRGGLHLMTGELDKARRDLDRCVAADETFALGYLRRGKYWEMTGNKENALADYRMAAKALPSSDEAWHEVTLAEIALGNFEQAESAARHLLKLSRDPARAHKILGTVLLSRGKSDQAITQFGQAVAKNPNDVESLFLRGSVLAAEKKYAEALRDFDRAVEIFPEYLDPYMAKAKVFLVQGKPDNALVVYDGLLAKDAKNLFVLQARYELYQTLGRYDEALKDLQQIKRIKQPSWSAQ